MGKKPTVKTLVTKLKHPSTYAVRDPQRGLIFYAWNTGKELRAPKKATRVAIYQGGQQTLQWTWMERGERAWAFEKPTKFYGTKSGKPPGIGMVAKAMARTGWKQPPQRQWYDEPKVVKTINHGVALGWLRRPSMTQVEWSEKGVDEAKRKLGLFGGTGTLRQAPKLETLVAELNATLKK